MNILIDVVVNSSNPELTIKHFNQKLAESFLPELSREDYDNYQNLLNPNYKINLEKEKFRKEQSQKMKDNFENWERRIRLAERFFDNLWRNNNEN